MAAIDSDTNLPAINAAWHGLKEAGDWVLLDLDGSVLRVFAHGNGGINELRSHLDASKVLWGGLSVIGVDELSGVTTKSAQRISFTFLGENVNAVKKSQASQQKGTVKDKAFPGNNATLDLTHPDDLTTKEVTEKLTKRAHLPKRLDFGGGVVVQL